MNLVVLDWQQILSIIYTDLYLTIVKVHILEVVQEMLLLWNEDPTIPEVNTTNLREEINS